MQHTGDSTRESKWSCIDGFFGKGKLSQLDDASESSHHNIVRLSPMAQVVVLFERSSPEMQKAVLDILKSR